MGTSKGYLPPTGHLWTDTKRAVSSMVRNNSSSKAIGKAISNFSKANGSNNSRNKGNSVIATSGSKIMNFGNLVRSIGLNNALDQVGLSHLKGKEAHAVFEGLLDYFSEGTNSLQQSIANQAMQEYMEEIMGSVRDEEELEEVFVKLDTDVFIKDYITKYIEVSFFTNFAEKINSMCKDIGEAIRMQGRIREFIRLEVSDSYKMDGLQNIDWRGIEGRTYIENKCEEVWGIFDMWSDLE
ncbi:hypothetical protein [Priestia megaterium]|uniref:hypothetical protein n=1 Tax=Priestia megaterium TaxID=1404 RepID=UPI0012B85CED|nr:hypothetical protein [Priestia megaterium]